MTRKHPGAQLGAYLAELRVEQGLTQRELAEKLGLSSGEVISRWERGEREPRLEMLSAIADALGVGLSEFVNAAFGVRMMRVDVMSGAGVDAARTPPAFANRVPNPAGSSADQEPDGRGAMVESLMRRLLAADERAFIVAWNVATAALDSLDAARDGAGPSRG